MKKAVSGIMLTLLILTSMLTLAFNIQPVKAEPAEIIIDTEVGESRFTTYPLRQSPYYWVHVQDHDTFYTRAYASNFWYTLCGAEGTGEPLYYGQWQASLPYSGQYEVFVWIPNPDPFEYGGRVYTPTQSAIYQIYYKDGMTTRTVNQRLRTGGWYSVGTYTFDTTASVILNDRTGEPYLSTMIAFDAIKFVQVNIPPTLSNGYVSPSSGDTSTTFSYYVTYSDQEGDVPTTKYVYIDGSPYTMTKISGDYVSGAVFKYSTTLSAGSHNYYFNFDDSHGHAVWLPTSGTYPGPSVTPPPQFGFTVGVSPSSGSVQQGRSVSATVTVTLTSGSPQTVSLTTSGLPPGASATFNPSSGYPTFTSTVTISTSTTTPTGTFYITITGSGGDLTRTATYTLTVTAPNFSISASPSSLPIQLGSSASSTIDITSINGFNQPVQLSVSGAPSGVTATLSPSQVTPPAGGTATSTLTVSVGTTATPGSYTLTVTGTSGSLTHSTYISLQITAPVNQPPNKPTVVSQYRSDGVTVIPEGGTTPESTVVFKATVSDPDGDFVRLEIELRQISEAFTGEPTPETISDYVPSGTQATITRNGLVDADYHWRYRAKDSKGATSDWTEFGTAGNIDFTVSIPDTTPPATVTDLSIFFISTYTLGLSWTAPGDDGNIGTASEYDLRYSTSPITEANWDLATRVTGEPKPSEAGSDETFYVRGLSSGTTYYFALKAADEVPNWSSLSNVASRTTLQNQPPVASFTYSPTKPKSGEQVTFDASASYDPDLEGEIVSYKWDFGDGTASEGEIVNHRFRGAQNEPKTYTVTLTVEDNDGATDTETISVTVEPLTKLVDVGSGYFGVSCWMKTTYNWVGTDEATGENLYIISKIETYSGGISGTYQLFILRRTSPPPSIPKLVWYIPLPTAPILRTYVTPFTPSVWQQLWGEPAEITTLTFQEGTFQGIGVTDTSPMLIVATGTETGILLYYDAGVTHFEPSSPITYLKPEELKGLWEFKDILDLLNKTISIIGSPSELRIYDSEGRVTGLVNGEVKEEIPGSAYTNGTIMLLYPNETYRYELVGIHSGTYRWLTISVENVDATTFNATDIPTSPSANHQYTIDWATLSLGEEGITVQVDSDGDGVFEHTFTSDSELTQSEFLAQMAFYTFSIVWGAQTFIVSVESNSTVNNFAFNQPDKEISFNVTGEAVTIGFCNVTIPKALLYGEPWTVLIDGAPVPATITENATHCSLYFTYTHSTHTIQIIGTWVIAPPPPPTYNLTITTTVGGTTNPAPGTYTYTANASVQVTAIPNADYLFDHWELDTINVGSTNPYTVLMDNNHTLKAVFTYSPPPPSLSASISPLSASILVGQSVTFTSTVSGGVTPYTYQWYLNGNPVAGATSNTWTFTPTSSGIYYVYLKVTDNVGNVENSNHSNVTVVGPDINGDGKVDMADVAIAGRAFGTVPGDARWNPLADVNLDGKVDLRDIALTAKTFGKHCP